MATLVAILKTARQMGLYQDLSHVEVPGEGSVAVPAALLRRAVASSTESLQVDALQLACVHPRGTSLPGLPLASLLLDHDTDKADKKVFLASATLLWRDIDQVGKTNKQ